MRHVLTSLLVGILVGILVTCTLLASLIAIPFLGLATGLVPQIDPKSLNVSPVNGYGLNHVVVTALVVLGVWGATHTGPLLRHLHG